MSPHTRVVYMCSFVVVFISLTFGPWLYFSFSSLTLPIISLIQRRACWCNDLRLFFSFLFSCCLFIFFLHLFLLFWVACCCWLALLCDLFTRDGTFVFCLCVIAILHNIFVQFFFSIFIFLSFSFHLCRQTSPKASARRNDRSHSVKMPPNRSTRQGWTGARHLEDSNTTIVATTIRFHTESQIRLQMRLSLLRLSSKTASGL